MTHGSASQPSTAGQQLTDELGRYFHIGPRTRRYRKHSFAGSQDMHEVLVEALETNGRYPGYYSETTTEALKPGYTVAMAWRKHVDGYRIDANLRYQISTMTPYRLAALLGRMVDAGVTNAFEGEMFFQRMAGEMRAAKAA